MATFKLNETGVTFRVNAGFVMTSNTELEIVFIKPDGTEVVKASADGVTLGTSTIQQDVDGVDTTFTANEYLEYEIESGLLDVAGTWRAYGRYTNTGESPTDYFIGNTSNVVVQDPANLN